MKTEIHFSYNKEFKKLHDQVKIKTANRVERSCGD